MARKHHIYRPAAEKTLPLEGHVVIGGKVILVAFREWSQIRTMRIRKGGDLGHRMTSTESRLLSNKKALDEFLRGELVAV